jgi:putative flippase GtrA
MRELKGQVSNRTETQLFKYLIFAGLATLVNIILRFILSEYILLGYTAAITTAYLLGMFINFTLNKVYTFPSGHRRIYQEGRTFVVIAVIGLLLTNLIALLFVYIGNNILNIQIAYNLLKTYSHILAVGLVAVYSFLGHKYLTFRGGIRKLFVENQ